MLQLLLLQRLLVLSAILGVTHAARFPTPRRLPLAPPPLLLLLLLLLDAVVVVVVVVVRRLRRRRVSERADSSGDGSGFDAWAGAAAERIRRARMATRARNRDALRCEGARRIVCGE